MSDPVGATLSGESEGDFQQDLPGLGRSQQRWFRQFQVAGVLSGLIVTLLLSGGCFQAEQGTPSGPKPTETSSPPSTQTQSAELAPVYLFELCSQGETAKVIKIVDGDTIDVRLADSSEERVRYIGIDTPEIGEACYAEATQRNRELVENQSVLLNRDVSERDIYGRLVRYVCLPSGQFIEAQLVAEGYARAYRYYPDTRYADYFSELENEAQMANRGCLHTTSSKTLDASGTACCKVCRSSQPCGDSCISWDQHCEHDPGCACGG
ncbi:MAG: thermonuclease family protein [Thiotrichales bacterium]